MRLMLRLMPITDTEDTAAMVVTGTEVSTDTALAMDTVDTSDKQETTSTIQ